MADSEQQAEQAYDRSRRRFIKGAIALVGAAGTATLFSGEILKLLDVSLTDVRAMSPQDRSWVMLIDLDKCNGCGKCTVGCTEAHFVPFGQQWIKVYEVQDEFGHRYFLPKPCMQCENAPCLKVCPVGATFQRKDGVVLVDHTRCIGCRYCMAACPYDARSFNWTEPPHTPEELAHAYSPDAPWPHRQGVVEKCMFCAHNTEHGELPACVKACTEEMGNGAIYFGDLREDTVSNGVETIPFAKTLRDRGGFRLKEELGTAPRVWYLPPRKG